MSAHIRIFLFLSQSDVCLLKPPKNRYFLYQALVHSTVHVSPITDRHFFNCSILSNDSWRKCVWIFFILHSETFRIATFWNAFAHSRIVQKGQPMVVIFLWNSFLVYLETWKIKLYILLHIYYFLSIDW